MAYIFPVNPYDGQLYPVPATPGALQYQWSEELRVWLIYSPLGVQSVTGVLPIVITNPTDDVVVAINPATINAAGSMSGADKAKLDGIPADAAAGTVTQVNTGAGLGGGPITVSGTVTLEPAKTNTIGGVIIGSNIDVSPNGTITIPSARFGVTSINLGPGLIGSPSPITSTGTITAALATRLSVGAVRVGAGIAVAPDGTISVDGALAKAAILAYASVQVAQNSSPPVFTILESYNISAITWAGSTNLPRVRLTFQNPLADLNFGFISGAMSSQTFPPASGTFPQRSQNINLSNKSASFIEVQLCTTSVSNVLTGTNNTSIWNDWSNSVPGASGGPAGITQFDIAIIDTPVF
jgi:hypothetical protein